MFLNYVMSSGKKKLRYELGIPHQPSILTKCCVLLVSSIFGAMIVNIDYIVTGIITFKSPILQMRK